jgi:hypothetical protein
MERGKPPLSARLLHALIRGIDALLRRRYGIIEFEQGADAMLRVGVGQAEREIALRDGTRLRPDDSVLEIHFWNEHLMTLPPGGATLRWAAVMRRRGVRSLRRLAEYLRTSPELGAVQALRIRPAFASRNLARNLGWFVARYGFESVSDDGPEVPSSGVGRWLDSLWVWLLNWTYNPRSLRGRRFRRTRQEFWISRTKFAALYGTSSEAAAVPAPQDRRSIGVR